MPLARVSSAHLKAFRGRSRRGNCLVTALCGLTALWIVLGVRKVILRYRPLPSQMRAQTQARELPGHLAASEKWLTLLQHYGEQAVQQGWTCIVPLVHANDHTVCYSGLSTRQTLERHRWRSHSGEVHACHTSYHNIISIALHIFLFAARAQ